MVEEKENLHITVKQLEETCEKLEKENKEYIDDVYKKSDDIRELKKYQKEHDKTLDKIKKKYETLLDAKKKDSDTFFFKNLGFSKVDQLGKIEIEPIIDVYKFVDKHCM